MWVTHRREIGWSRALSFQVVSVGELGSTEEVSSELNQRTHACNQWLGIDQSDATEPYKKNWKRDDARAAEGDLATSVISYRKEGKDLSSV